MQWWVLLRSLIRSWLDELKGNDMRKLWCYEILFMLMRLDDYDEAMTMIQAVWWLPPLSHPPGPVCDYITPNSQEWELFVCLPFIRLQTFALRNLNLYCLCCFSTLLSYVYKHKCGQRCSTKPWEALRHDLQVASLHLQKVQGGREVGGLVSQLKAKGPTCGLSHAWGSSWRPHEAHAFCSQESPSNAQEAPSVY